MTADGEVRVVDDDHDPDLFWAIRGGGGNFGVVTRFKFRLHPVPEAVGGMLFLPATADTIAGFVAAAQAAPESLSTIANVMPCPPMPFVPEAQHGKLVIFGLLCWAGPVDEGQAAMAPFRALATPVADMLRPISYAEMYPPAEPDYHPLAISRTFFLDRFDRAVAETILEHLEASDAAMRVAQIRALGGAMARVDPAATAFALRDRPIMVTVASFYEGDHDKARREAWVTDLAAALHQRDGAYVNFLADGGEGRIRDAYPGRTWDRLVEVKRRYDPENLFHRNQNIPPEPLIAMSERSLAAKLLVKPGDLVWVSDPARGALLGPLPDGARLTGGGRVDAGGARSRSCSSTTRRPPGRRSTPTRPR